MNKKLIFNTIGSVLKIEGALMLLPVITALAYSEFTIALWLTLTILIALGIGFTLTLTCKPSSYEMFAKDGFIIVAFSWLAVSLIGCLPFIFSREIPSFFNAFFETVSGFTTTGATILHDPSTMSKGLLMWRSFTHWIGGMGMLVFVIALMPKTTDKTIHILRAEMPGPTVDKIVPRSKNTAKILYLIYVGMTVALILLLWVGGMPLFESIVHALGTAGTGGFSIYSTSIELYSPFIQWVIALFMLLFGINFNIYFLILIGKFKNVLKSTELLTYLLIVLTAVVVVAFNIYPLYNNLNDTIRVAFFEVSAITTTTGYGVANINVWNSVAKTVLIVLMLIGACAGSTAGGFKISRMILLFKKAKKDFVKITNPHSVDAVYFEGKRVDEQTVNSVATYFYMYVLIIIVGLICISFDGLDLETNISSIISCFNNIGPAYSKATLNYDCFSGFSKIILSFLMLLGRLEIYPVLIAFSASTWIKR